MPAPDRRPATPDLERLGREADAAVRNLKLASDPRQPIRPSGPPPTGADVSMHVARGSVPADEPEIGMFMRASSSLGSSIDFMDHGVTDEGIPDTRAHHNEFLSSPLGNVDMVEDAVQYAKLMASTGGLGDPHTENGSETAAEARLDSAGAHSHDEAAAKWVPMAGQLEASIGCDAGFQQMGFVSGAAVTGALQYRNLLDLLPKRYYVGVEKCLFVVWYGQR